MYTVINSISGEEIRSHYMFRCSNIFPNLILANDEQVIFIPDLLVEEINSAYECSITVDEEGVATVITVTKTMEQWKQENPLPPQEPTELDYLLDLDFRLCMLELGL